MFEVIRADYLFALIGTALQRTTSVSIVVSAKEHIKKLIENNSLNIATLHISFHVPVFVYIHIEIDISKMRKMRSPDREVLISDEPEPEFSSSSRAELGHFNFRAESEPNQKVPGLKKSKSPGFWVCIYTRCASK